MIHNTTILKDIHVLDFSSFVPGPLAAKLLADSGAQVIKIEPPTGDPLNAPPFTTAVSPAYQWLNRRKQCQQLDLKNLAALELLLQKIPMTDIVIETFRPGVMQRLGLDYEKLRIMNPGLIYCAISGFGQKQRRPGHDLNFQAEAGLLPSTPVAGRFSLPSALLADISAGSYPAMINILLALQQRKETGLGCYLDINMTANLQPFYECSRFTNLPSDPAHELLDGASPRYQIYSTRDGGKVVVAALEEHFWQCFCHAIGVDAEKSKQKPALVIDHIAELIAHQTRHYWHSAYRS